MRILFTGAAYWVNSGYGKPIRNIVPMLVDAGHGHSIRGVLRVQGNGCRDANSG